ncbi:agmatine deiminase family protein [soil metagenome]
MSDGFRFPAEWEPHEATLLSWPNRRGVSYPDEATARVEPTFLAMAEALALGRETVCINVSDEAERDRIAGMLAPEVSARVRFLPIPTDEPWVRDHGPTILRRDADGARRAVCWEYNAWGEKYRPFDQDAAAGGKMAENLGIGMVRPGIVVEGGSLDANGTGLVLVSESSVANPNRNPGRDRAELEAILSNALGGAEILWVNAEVPGDDTDGHVDCFARFVAVDHVLASRPSADQVADYPTLEANFVHLSALGRERGFRVDPLPIPGKIVTDGMVLPATYANFYIGNGVILCPVFEDRHDDPVAAVLGAAFPGRRIAQIPARDLIWGQGGFHCLTQQIPA